MTGTAERVLGLARQSSQDRDAGTLETQRILINDGCAMLGLTLIELVEDQQSGKYSVFDDTRRGCAGWLNDPAKLAQWDTLMVTKRDRIDRDVIYRLTFLRWALDNGKRVITADGKEISIASAEQWQNEANAVVNDESYRRAVGEKRSDTARLMARRGQIGFGDWGLAYGYRRWLCEDCRKARAEFRKAPVYCPNDGCKRPVIHPAEAEVIRRIVRELCEGLTLTAIAEGLNRDGIPTRRAGHVSKAGKRIGGRWEATGMSKAVRRLSEPYARASDGSPYYLPEIVPARKLAEAQAKLGSRSFKKRPKDDTTRHDGTPLLNVAYCAEGHKLNSFTTGGTNGRKVHRYMRCYTCKRMVRREDLHMAAHQWLTFHLGDMPHMAPVPVAASNHETELAGIVRQMDDIESQIMNGFPAASAARILTALQARRDELEAMPVREARTVYQSTGRTIGQEWEGLTWEERGRMLRDAGARLVVPFAEFDGTGGEALRVHCDSADLAQVLRADVAWTYSPATAARRISKAA